MSERRPLFRRATAGAVAGTIATAPMSLLMLAAQKRGLMDKHPPEEITEAALDQVGARSVSEPVEDALTVVNHFAFGAVAGALYGLARREGFSDAAQGTIFALGVWTVSYMGWVPALHIMPAAPLDQRGRPATMIAAHVVFGAVMGKLTERFLD